MDYRTRLVNARLQMEAMGHRCADAVHGPRPSVSHRIYGLALRAPDDAGGAIGG